MNKIANSRLIEKIAAASHVLSLGVPLAFGTGGYMSKRKGGSAAKGHLQSAAVGATAGGIAGGFGSKVFKKTLSNPEIKKQLGKETYKHLIQKMRDPRAKALMIGGGAVLGAVSSPLYHGLGRLFAKSPEK